EEGAHEKSPKCLGGNLGDFGEFCKGLRYLNDNRQAAFRLGGACPVGWKRFGFIMRKNAV
ncbi:TPA: hypothetical protein ACLA34_002032, partial [Neisseria meningitidis]